MKYMKLGCRPDTFYTAEAVRSVSSEILSDLIVQVKSCRYLLHRFPMLSKCLRLQSLMSSQCPETSQQQVIQLPDFPGEAEAFELCAKFCYGITITLSAYNIVAVRCAAEYLEMTEEAENGNMIQKVELFLTSCVFNGWKDSIVALQTTKALQLWSEDLGITTRCIEAISSKVSANPSKTSLSRCYSRRGRAEISINGSKVENSDWWGEDMADLGIDLYCRTMIAIKSSGRNISSRIISDALRIYTSKWLPNIGECTDRKKHAASDSDSDPGCSKHRLILESVISLLPTEKGAVPCSFLLQLLKITNILKASSSSKLELARKAAIQLDEAAVSDLLIPLSDKSGMLYDVDIVATMVKEFLSQKPRTISPPPTSPPKSRIRMERRRSRSEEQINFEVQESRRSSSSSSAAHSSKLKVARLVDVYLQQIAKDVNLPLSQFITLAEMIPESSRIDHDDLYKAIDVYLQAHPNIEKGERKRLCRILDCKKLSPVASKHAAQNELLPLRVIVQVLFFEHARAASAGGNITEPPGDIRTPQPNPPRETVGLSTSKIRRSSTLRSKLAEEDELLAQNGLNPDGHFQGTRCQSTPSRFKAFCAIPRQPKKMFSKLLSINRSLSQRN